MLSNTVLIESVCGREYRSVSRSVSDRKYARLAGR
jgi:hypothetical protein